MKEGLRALHIAAMPFPTPQGTQAAVHAMLAAVSDGTDEGHALLTYGEGATDEVIPFPVHRVASVRGLPVSPVSGPSLPRLGADARLLRALPATVHTRGADVIVAHHVEAAMVAALGRVRPWLFVAHTALEPELPAYFPRSLAPALARTGRWLDRSLLRSAGARAAVSPALCERLSAQANCRVEYLPVPWTTPDPSTEDERVAARARLGVAENARLVLYAGNLDAYQGWEDAVDAVAQLRAAGHDACLLVATASDSATLVRRATSSGLGAHARVVPVRDERGRRACHAATDAALVPRRHPGGVPIKLLDSLARGTPTVATERACAGLPIADAVVMTENDSPRALAAGILRVLCSSGLRHELRAAGPRYVREEHGIGPFRAILAQLLRDTAAPPQVKIPSSDR